MRKNFLIMLTAVAILLSAGCVYQANLSQGNLLKQEDLDQVEIGMTRNQVRFLLGTPMIDDPFHQDRWDYIYFIRIKRQSAAFKRWVSIHFEEGVVSEIVEDQDLSPDL
jgi:outer membrane protein assembly factor BamE